MHVINATIILAVHVVFVYNYITLVANIIFLSHLQSYIHAPLLPMSETTATVDTGPRTNAESDVECFYDAVEDATTKHDDDVETCIVENHYDGSDDSDFESTAKKLDSLRATLNDDYGGDDANVTEEDSSDARAEFVPLHRRLNKEKQQQADRQTSTNFDLDKEDDDVIADQEEDKPVNVSPSDDPFFVDETLVAKADDESSDEQKQVRLLPTFFFLLSSSS